MTVFVVKSLDGLRVDIQLDSYEAGLMGEEFMLSVPAGEVPKFLKRLCEVGGVK